MGSIWSVAFRGNSAQRNSLAGVLGESNEPRPALQLELLSSQGGHRVGGGAPPRGLHSLGRQVLWGCNGNGPHVRRNPIQSREDRFLSLPNSKAIILWASRQQATSLERTTPPGSHSCAFHRRQSSQNSHGE